MVADPKGIQHILQGSGYNYLNSAEDRQLLRMVAGEGLAWVHGDSPIFLPLALNPLTLMAKPIQERITVAIGRS